MHRIASRIAAMIVALFIPTLLSGCVELKPTDPDGNSSGLGKSWQVVRDRAFHPRLVAASPDVIVGLVPSAGARVSTDGQNWEQIQLAGELPFGAHNLIWTGSQFVGYGGTVKEEVVRSYLVISSDGHNWSTSKIQTEGIVRAVANSPSGLLAIMNNGIVLSSSDAVVWNVRDTVPEMQTWYGWLVWADSVFVFCTDYGAIWGSADGSDWQEYGARGTLGPIRKLVWTGGQVFGLGSNRVLYSSFDARN